MLSKIVAGDILIFLLLFFLDTIRLGISYESSAGVDDSHEISSLILSENAKKKKKKKKKKIKMMPAVDVYST